MRLTTKGRFAVTAMIDLAMRQHQGPVTLAGISQRQKIRCLTSSSCSATCRHELVDSTRIPAAVHAVAQRQGSLIADIFCRGQLIDATQCGGKENCTDDGQ
jgi:Rrf2 family iron-sulfur cluster assembly transcriptional regulator